MRILTNRYRKYTEGFIELLQETVDFKIHQGGSSCNSLQPTQQFFRLKRTFILNINSIKDVLVYSNSRLKITLTQAFDKEIIVSREKVGIFKEWFDGH